MYCDENGRPDPNGDYELVNGKQLLRDGRAVRFNVLMMDGKPAAPSASRVFLRDHKVDLTDAQWAFADSAEGRSLIARAEMMHQQQHAYMGDAAPDFTDAHKVSVVHSALTAKANGKSGPSTTQHAADVTRLAMQAADTRSAKIADMSQAYRQR